MKLKKVLTTSMLCALVCTALPVANSYADEMEKVEVKIHSTSIAVSYTHLEMRRLNVSLQR